VSVPFGNAAFAPADGSLTLSVRLSADDLAALGDLSGLVAAAENAYEAYDRGANDEDEADLAEHVLGPLASALRAAAEQLRQR